MPPPPLDRGARQLARRWVAGAMWAAAVAWGVVVARMAIADEAEPPIGAICFALPAIALLIGGGLVWPTRPRTTGRRRR